MNTTATPTITPEVSHFLEAMGFGIRNVSPNGLRVILSYAITGYLCNYKPVDFPIAVAHALDSQTLVPLTEDIKSIIAKLQALHIQEIQPEKLKTLLREYMRILEEKHKNPHITSHDLQFISEQIREGSLKGQFLYEDGRFTSWSVDIDVR